MDDEECIVKDENGEPIKVIVSTFSKETINRIRAEVNEAHKQWLYERTWKCKFQKSINGIIRWFKKIF